MPATKEAASMVDALRAVVVDIAQAKTAPDADMQALMAIEQAVLGIIQKAHQKPAQMAAQAMQMSMPGGAGAASPGGPGGSPPGVGIPGSTGGGTPPVGIGGNPGQGPMPQMPPVDELRRMLGANAQAS